jgi:hypothetical protein
MACGPGCGFANMIKSLGATQVILFFQRPYPPTKHFANFFIVKLNLKNIRFVFNGFEF